MASTTLKARLARLECDDDTFEILNPRWYDYEGPMSEAEFEAANQARVAAALAEQARGGPRVITIPAARNFD